MRDLSIKSIERLIDKIEAISLIDDKKVNDKQIIFLREVVWTYPENTNESKRAKLAQAKAQAKRLLNQRSQKAKQELQETCRLFERACTALSTAKHQMQFDAKKFSISWQDKRYIVSPKWVEEALSEKRERPVQIIIHHIKRLINGSL